MSLFIRNVTHLALGPAKNEDGEYSHPDLQPLIEFAKANGDWEQPMTRTVGREAAK